MYYLRGYHNCLDMMPKMLVYPLFRTKENLSPPSQYCSLSD